MEVLSVVVFVITFSLGFFAGFKTGKESARERCVSILKKKAEDLYSIETAKPGTIIGDDARITAHIYSAAAMLIRESEV